MSSLCAKDEKDCPDANIYGGIGMHQCPWYEGLVKGEDTTDVVVDMKILRDICYNQVNVSWLFFF